MYTSGPKVSSNLPRVSVVMSVHNGAKYLSAAVESVLAQEYPAWELIAIDDASSDDSLEILNSFSDPRIRIIRNESNRGLPYSLNYGVSVARAPFIARLDADDLCLPNRLGDQVRALELSGGSVCFCEHQVFTEDEVPEIPAQLKEVPERPWLGIVWRGLFFQGYGAHPAVMIRKAALEEVGGFDESYKYAQDYDLFDRLVAQGERFHYTKRTGIFYRSHGGQISQAKVVDQERLARRVIARAVSRLISGVGSDEIDGLARFWGRPQCEDNESLSLGLALVKRLAATFQEVHGDDALPKECWSELAFHATRCLPELKAARDKKEAWRLVAQSALRSTPRQMASSVARAIGVKK